MMVAAGWLALTGCSDAMDPIPNPTPDPSPEVRREALSITTTLSGSAVQTKAAGSNLAVGDVLYAYIRQVEKDGSSDYKAVDPSVEQWVTLTVKGASAAVNPTVTPNRESTSSFQETVYWDDFSTTEHDLRAEGHALQSYYGYCYNGHTGHFAPNEKAGKLTWQVAADQTGGYQTSDLLWSNMQNPVEYIHGTQGDSTSHGTLTIPYTHAMSKVTVVVKTDGVFDGTALASTSAELTQVYQQGEMNAPEGTVVPVEASKDDIQMHPIAEATEKTFEALMIPGLKLTEGLTLAQINNVANNNYKIALTDKILTSWSSQLAEGKTMPGVNYKLTLTVKKQSVNIVASLTDWVNVEATGEGIVRFTNDVTSITGGTGGTALADGSAVDVFWVKRMAEETALSTVATTDYATTSTYHATDAKWTNDPALYWDNGTDCYYFRGLAKKEGDAIKSYKPTSGDYSFDVEQSTDLLWATTPAHTGQLEGGGTKEYTEGTAINPRTGNVPLRFDHAMSQISFKLQTTEGADKVELDGATLSLAQVVKKGTIEPASGKITPSAEEGDKADLTLTTDPSIVVPQTLTDEMILTIRLKDNTTTYKIALKNCKLTDGTAVTTWEGGKHYTYTITLKKEAVQLIAFVKNWVVVNVNGDANLDWD